jgi:sortase B
MKGTAALCEVADLPGKEVHVSVTTKRYQTFYGYISKAVKSVNYIINFILLLIILLLLVFSCYAIWDSEQIYQSADKLQYAVYKPTVANEGKSFKELQTINPEVFAWLTVFGTSIDYPVTQGSDNMKYVNTNAEGNYALSGAIFLDTNNSKDFSDFNNILYGHHMQKNMMFGEIALFADESFFETHRYGSLYFNEKKHGIEFFAFVHTSAYDETVFTPNVRNDDRRVYLENLIEKAMYVRDIEVTPEDNIVLLSTCSSSSTNGRDILVAKITDRTFRDTFEDSQSNNEDIITDCTDGIVRELDFRVIVLGVLLTVLILIIYHRQITRERSRDNEE